MNNNWYKKEKPLLGLTGLGGGVDGLGVVGVATKTYIDDVFSTYLYKGTGDESGATGQTITNEIDLSGKGGMTWIKVRTNTTRSAVVDTVRGAGKMLATNEDSVSTAADLTGLASFNSDGFTLGNESGGYQRCNMENQDYVSWSFAKQKGFFDIVTWTGNGSNRTISHSLGSIPGCIMVKRTDTAQDWAVYHRGNGATKNFYLNSSGGVVTDSVVWNDTEPTSSVFSVGTHAMVNANGGSYVAYIFAGGASTAATARSVEFDSTWPGDDLKIAKNSDFQYGTGDFTWEAYVKPTDLSSSNRYVLNHVDMAGVGTIGGIYIHLSNQCLAYENASGSGDTILANRKIYTGQWTHVAVSRNSGITRLFQNGLLVGTGTHDDYSFPQSNFHVGINYSASGNGFDGNISNVRIIKGTGLYTSSFTPPTEPLTNVTNTKLLCCNNSSVTGSTVSPGTITSEGNTPTASTDSPFTDTAGFAFGEDEDKQIVATGSYEGNGSARGPDVFLGWQPQYVLIKRTDSAENWNIYDSMRGIWSEQNDKELRPESSALEYSYSRVDLTPEGFKPMTNNQYTNQSGGTYIYLAFRGSDGYVGKPAEAGTEVFSMNSGSASGAPLFDSTHVVDFQFVRGITTSADWEVGARLLGPKQVYFNTNGSQTEIDASGWKYDYMDGWHTNASGISNYMCWMFKRHKGMDVICFRGNSANRLIAHGLNAAPEMIIVKQRTSSTDWQVYHKGLNGGTNPEQYRMVLNSYAAEQDDNTAWNDTAPTTTHFSLGTMAEVNNNGEDLIAFLFTSVEGISKCGYYNGSNSDQTITLGFQPRFFMCKARDEGTADYDWMVVDSARGLVGASGQRIFLNSTGSQDSANVVDSVSSTGITLQGTKSDSNFSGREYIYYAHA